MSLDKEDYEIIDFNSNWKYCFKEINDNIHNSLLTILKENNQWLSIKLPHIINNDNKSLNYWYKKEFNWILSNEKLNEDIYLYFNTLNEENQLNIISNIWINEKEIFSNNLLKINEKIKIPKEFLYSNDQSINDNKNILIISCLNRSLSINVQLIIYEKFIYTSGKINIDNNNNNNEKENDILKYTAHLNDKDGRICVAFKHIKDKVKLSSSSSKKHSFKIHNNNNNKEIEENFQDKSIPHLAIVILIVGTRGDVQPFIALGQSLIKYGHRVRLATHESFRSFVRGNGLEFYPLAGDPSDLMSFMVKNAGIIPSIGSIIDGDVTKNCHIIEDILKSTWLACIDNDDETHLPFVAEAIIANPPSYGHIHCAEKLQIPLHIMFTMPWSPTTHFPHPLCNIDNSKGQKDKLNFYSYHLIEILTWSAMHNIINNFRKKILGLSTLRTYEATNILIDQCVPHTYCWSKALVEKPSDWDSHINVSGFFFLDLGITYNNPPKDLIHFLEINKSSPPIYIGFGSITGHDSRRILQVIIDAIQLTGYTALLSGLATDNDHLPEQIFKINNIPHDWLFQYVSSVCHHGGAGTTAAGLRAGKPTIIVPFFGDQFFWGHIIKKSGAGPHPLPGKTINANQLAEAFRFVHQPSTRIAAEKIQSEILKENGCQSAIDAFHSHLPLKQIRSDLESTYAACYRIDNFNIQISRPVAGVLIGAGLIDITQLRSHHTQQWNINHNYQMSKLTHAFSESIRKSSSNLISNNNDTLRRTVSNSTENLTINKNDHTNDIDKSIFDNIKYQNNDVLSSYGKMIDDSNKILPIYDPYSKSDKNDSESLNKTPKQSLWHKKKNLFNDIFKRSNPNHFIGTNTANALIATTNHAIQPAIGTYPSTTYLGRTNFDIVKQAVNHFKKDQTLLLSSSSSTTDNEHDDDKSSNAHIASVISGLSIDICEQIINQFNQIKNQQITTNSLLIQNKHSKHIFKRQRSHSMSNIN